VRAQRACARTPFEVGGIGRLGLYLLGKLRRKNIDLLDERRLREKL
jgi:hypothetical protein